MHFDILLKGGSLIDGAHEHSVPRKVDLGIENDRIAAIGEIPGGSADKIIDVQGLYITPGFIDTHGHSEFTLLADGRAEGKISQGITTEINGNCGLSASPLRGHAREQRTSEFEELNIHDQWDSFSEYFGLLRKKRNALNFLTLVGHGNLRGSAIGYEDRQLSDDDRQNIFNLLKTSLDAGAIGLSTGLVYPPGVFARPPEIIGLAQATQKMGGRIYTTHMRSEGDELLEAIDEALNVGFESSIPVHISHIKTSEERNWGKLGKALKKIHEARQSGLTLTCDRYPYTAASTSLDSVLPAWVFEGGKREELRKIQNMQGKIEDDILRTHPEESYWDSVTVSKVKKKKSKWMEGMRISEIARRSERNPLQSLFHILIEEELDVDAIFFSMSEDNLERILRCSYTVIGTDSAARSFQGITARGKPHPRGFGSFPRVLGRYVREKGIISLEESIYKMTGLPAKIFGIEKRGILKVGYFADITVFDPRSILDTADFGSPFQRPVGIHHVFVNGAPVMIHGEITGSLPGRVLN
ncbi:D-aminoacylase [bacterium]|nr:MAG: D-aminoacylase [bacterium]